MIVCDFLETLETIWHLRKSLKSDIMSEEMSTTKDLSWSQLHFQYKQARLHMNELKHQYYDTFRLEHNAHAALTKWFARDPDLQHQELNEHVRDEDDAHTRLMDLDERLNCVYEQLNTLFQQIKDAACREFVAGVLL